MKVVFLVYLQNNNTLCYKNLTAIQQGTVAMPTGHTCQREKWVHWVQSDTTKYTKTLTCCGKSNWRVEELPRMLEHAR